MSAPAHRPDSRSDAALDLLVRGRAHIFLTGRAGTGKTTLIRRFMEQAGEEAAIVAPTGVAAMNAGGQTIHSFFRLPPRLVGPRDVKRLRHAKVIRAIKTLVIDEVSMVRADLMAAIDLSLRLNRGNEEPFGGVRIIAVGDLAQLPPVVQGDVAQYIDEEFGGPFFFNAPPVAEAGFLRLELDTVFRQDDPDFIDILSGVRDADLTQSQANRLNARVTQATGFDASATHVVLTPTNEQAFRINAERLASLPGSEKSYDGAIKGEFDPRLFPTETPLMLKKGARVMMIRNDPGGRFVNGTLGEVEDMEDGAVRVRVGSEVHRVDPVAWERVKYVYDESEKSIGQEVIGAFKQLPLRLAWAMTVHKSQGLTLDKLYIDMGRGMFAHGQAYVALSRARSLDGLWLSRSLRPSDLVRDPRIEGIRSVTHAAPI
ncbi:MAG: AAA family ATPase [Maricaulis sp.]|jgi:ATP-dependent exoDNAse (exonuclease V) alpha subunit|nr:AAA family ATPase [Maricaulis sp.]HAQ33973.1 AAA family ATPase [Alphaproteobacteria bacterium]